jgi:hypothetical protein
MKRRRPTTMIRRLPMKGWRPTTMEKPTTMVRSPTMMATKPLTREDIHAVSPRAVHAHTLLVVC